MYVAFPDITPSDFKLQLNFELMLMVRIFQGYIECTKQAERYVTRDT